MNEKRKQRYLYINGEAVPVTEKVYRTFWHYEDKEDYFMRLLKTPRQIRDRETQEIIVVPAREIPMDQIPVCLRIFFENLAKSGPKCPCHHLISEGVVHLCCTLKNNGTSKRLFISSTRA